MLNKNIEPKPSTTSNSTLRPKPKMNNSLIMSPTFLSNHNALFTPKRRVDVGFKSPNFQKSNQADVMERSADESSSSSNQSKGFGKLPGFKKQASIWSTKPSTENKCLTKNLNHSSSNVKLSSKLKETASTNSPDLTELKSISSSPSFFKQKNYTHTVKLSTFSEKETVSMPPARSERNIRQLKRDQFQIIRKLGEGKFGKVYLALDKLSGMLVAIKSLEKLKIKAENLNGTIHSLAQNTGLSRPSEPH